MDEAPLAKNSASLLEHGDAMEMLDADDDKTLSVADDDSMASGSESIDALDDGEDSADDASDVARVDSSEESVDDAHDMESGLDDAEPGSSEMSDDIINFGIEQSATADMSGEGASATEEGASATS